MADGWHRPSIRTRSNVHAATDIKKFAYIWKQNERSLRQDKAKKKERLLVILPGAASQQKHNQRVSVVLLFLCNCATG